MSSGFVSAGTNEEPIERDDEWRKAQEELEEERRLKAELGRQEGGKSLYEVLQQNKMAKQEAFEEKIRLKNQFRALDEDEVEFLDSLLESTRAQEATIKKETAEQLEVFRRQREQAERALLEGASVENGPSAEEEDWTIPARKRRREKSKDLLLPGKKRRSLAAENSVGGGSSSQNEQQQKTNNPGAKTAGDKVVPSSTSGSISSHTVTVLKQINTTTTVDTTSTDAGKKDAADKVTSETKPAAATKPTSLSLGLAGYSSDSE